MRKVTLFIAMSLDGYIADYQGKVDWLEGQGDDTENIDSYSEFVKEVDTVVMGWNTYNQIVTELSPDEWIYNELTTYVITHRECISSERINFIDTDPVELVKRLRAENGKGIWICGGANVIQQLVNKNMIDCYYITVIPTILGTGIRLFKDSKKEIKLKLLKTQCYDGMTDLIYVRR
ncbi:MAG: dihydrofolate reductase family protein [Lachnospiraceae bacterium]|nr:dihydrofolate reductase family protein [Lachnospiraceae bacterium]